MSTITPYEKLTFSNDFLFCKILETKTELCKELVELIFGRKVKEIRNVRSQFSLKLSLGDKTQKVFLCTEGDKKDVSSEIMDFLDYVAGRKLEGKIAKELDAEVKNAREKEEWRAEYMQNMAAIMDAKREGHKEGIIQGGNNMLYELVQDGSISIDVASKKMGVSKKEFENKMNLCGYKQPKRT